jgi:parvulin-like peptidyl-prolyl isomerase
MGYVTRGDLQGEAARLVFAAKPGAVVGPVQLGKTHALIKVWSVKPATLDEATRRAISDDLFGAWLGKLLDKAKLRLP